MRAFCKPNSCRRTDQRGFTLLEAMIGLMVFTIGVLGMLKFQVVAINSNTMAHTSSANTNVGVSAIERLFAFDWDEQGAQPVPGITDIIGDSTVEWAITTGPSPGIIAMADDKGQPSVRLITVQSSFVDQGGTQRTTTLRLIKPRM
ncbi:MAG: prepilin-type N-terminal cleavage/methylation domain-containing protein [Desulfatitalea sp.]